MKKVSSTLLLLVLFQLASTAQLTTIWKDARFMKKPLQKIMVVPQFYDSRQREDAGVAILEALRGKGMEAVLAPGLIRYDSMYYYSTLERKLDSAGIDGILVVKLVEVRGTDMYVLPGEVIPPYAYNYYEYYSYYYYHDLPIIVDPNYYRKPGLSFRIDVCLYQNKGDMIVWGGQTKTLDPLRPVRSWDRMAKKIVKILLAEKLVAAGK